MAVRMKQLTADEKQRMYMEMEEDYYRVVATCYAEGFDKGEKSGFDVTLIASLTMFNR